MKSHDDLTLIVRDLIQASQALACSLEHIVTSFEQISGRIPEEKDVSICVSQFAGLHVRVQELLRQEKVTLGGGELSL